MPDLYLRHKESESCADVHCRSCGVDELAFGAHRICGECGHVYGSARELRRAFRRVVGDLAAPLGRFRGTVLRLLGGLVRAVDIRDCQECGHVFES